MATVKCPAWADTRDKKLLWSIRLTRKVALLQRAMEKWYEQGFTQVQYNKLSAKMKSRYPYAAKLTKAQLRDFARLWEDYTNSISMLRRDMFAEVGDDNTIDADIDRDIS